MPDCRFEGAGSIPVLIVIETACVKHQLCCYRKHTAPGVQKCGSNPIFFTAEAQGEIPAVPAFLVTIIYNRKKVVLGGSLSSSVFVRVV